MSDKQRYNLSLSYCDVVSQHQNEYLKRASSLGLPLGIHRLSDDQFLTFLRIKGGCKIKGMIKGGSLLNQMRVAGT